MDTLAAVGIITGAIIGCGTTLVGLWKIMQKINQILETREDATTAMNVAKVVEEKVDELKDQVTALSETTTETFQQRTQDFTRIAHEASTRLRELEKENASLKTRVARDEGRLDAHSIEDDRRFERIERTLADIREQLAHMAGQATAGSAPSSPTPPV